MIAREVGASETAFVLPSKSATLRLRFFTPTTEVDLCGHATIATWTLLREKGIYAPGDYSQETMAGTLSITVEKNTVFMQQPPQKLEQSLDPALVEKILRVKGGDLDKDFECQATNGAFMVALNDETTLNALKPDLDLMASTSNKLQCFAFHIFVLHKNGDLLASVRDFGPAIGVPEDPATGTSNGSLLAYLQFKDKLPDQDIYKIRQGIAVHKPSLILGKFIKDRVWVGGEATEYRRLTVEQD